MKELSALELYYLLKEFQVLKGAKVDQIFQPEDVLIRVHIPNTGKKIIRITNRFIFLTDFKEEQPQNPKQFCTFLRKTISNARIRSIEQQGFERVIKFVLEKQEKYHLFIELYAKGNVILTDDKNSILSVLHMDKNRGIFKGETYNVPKKDFNLLDFKESDVKRVLTIDESPVKSLAVGASLGGFYAEYVLSHIENPTPSKVAKELKKILKHKISPTKVKNRLVPFVMEGEKVEGTYNNALSDFLTTHLAEEERNRKLQPYLKEKRKIENIISTQEKEMKKQEKIIKENSQKGEKIYEQYQLLKEIIDEIQKATKKHSWDEIKKKLKNHKIIKEVDSKNRKIIVDI